MALGFTEGAGFLPKGGGGGGGGVTDHGALTGLDPDDDHGQYIFTSPQSSVGLGRAGGQFVVGGTAVSEELSLRGTSNANLGQIRCFSPIDFEDTILANALNAYFIQANPAQTMTAGFIGGGVNVSPTISFSNAVFIWEGLRGAPRITSLVGPAFAAFTLFQALPTLRTVSTFSPLNTLILNAGPSTEQAGVATAATTANVFGLAFSPQTRASAAFASMSITDQVGVEVRPTFSTVATSTVNLGNICGMRCQNPIAALFQPAAGTETMISYIGLLMENIPFGGNVLKVAVQSAQTAATNSYFLRQTGTAQSVFNGQARWDLDITGITFGASQDVNIGWAGATDELFFDFTGDDLRISNPSANRILIQGDVQATELNFNCDRFSLGAQSGAVGNTVGAFVTPVRTATVNGGWADFVLTHAGNITIDATLGQLAAWALNSVSITSGTGSITSDVATLLIGGMTSSNLGGADTAALYQTGRRTMRGVDAFEPLSPAALTVDVNDYAPATLNSMRQVWRVTTDDLGVRNITGIAVQQSVDTEWITNIGTVDNIVLQDQNVGSVAANRIISPTGADYVLGPDESALLWHDDTTDRWRILWGSGA